MVNKAKAQLLGIFILLVLGFLAINSPFILIIEGVAVVLFILWLITNRQSFLDEQISFISILVVLQLVFYMLFFILIGLESGLILSLLGIIPILSVCFLYPWAFGKKRTISKGRLFIILVFIVQVYLVILSIVNSLVVTSNLANCRLLSNTEMTCTPIARHMFNDSGAVQISSKRHQKHSIFHLNITPPLSSVIIPPKISRYKISAFYFRERLTFFS